MSLHESLQFSRSVDSYSLWLHELQHARPPCPSPTPRVHSDSCPSSQWCHPAISSSVIPFSSCLQSLPASESFPMSQLFSWGGQSIGVSALASFLPKKSQGWSPSEWTGWISLQSKGLTRVFSNTTVQKHQFFGTLPSSQTQTCRHIWRSWVSVGTWDPGRESAFANCMTLGKSWFLSSVICCMKLRMPTIQACLMDQIRENVGNICLLQDTMHMDVFSFEWFLLASCTNQALKIMSLLAIVRLQFEHRGVFL